MNEEIKQKKFEFSTQLEVEGQTTDLKALLTYNFANDTFKITGAITTKQCSASDDSKNQRTVSELGRLMIAAIKKGLAIREEEVAAKEGTSVTGNLFEQGGRPEETADDLPI